MTITIWFLVVWLSSDPGIMHQPTKVAMHYTLKDCQDALAALLAGPSGSTSDCVPVTFRATHGWQR